MIELLKTIIPENRVKTRYIDLVSFAADAGFYHLLPKAVVQPISEAEIISLFQFSQKNKIPLVFRTGGTSLSGQSITDGILVDLSQHWRNIKVEDNGKLVRVQPGITGAMVNAHLKKYNQKIGPDPSSISAAMMGGILSNNASGMCCGVTLNSYHTTKFIRFVLPDGNTFSTENKADYSRFETECSHLSDSLTAIKNEICQNELLYKKIRLKYQTKNTVGYSLNAFIDHTHPLDILAHLLIGAEGTLAFIAEAVLQTVPDEQFKSTALLYFPTIKAACEAIVPLTNAGAAMVELMDRASLRSVENLDGMPAIVRNLPDTAAALLIEFQEASWTALEERVSEFLLSTPSLELYNAPVFTSDDAEREFLWKVRKGLFPAVGAVRASGTTVILEDIAFPVKQLGNAITDLQKLFELYDYNNAIIFGHAKDGNIHFVVTQSFNSKAEVTRYDLFMREVIELVVKKYDGTLKAEHGTGRNMAPFVETEWGNEAYEIMKKIKLAVDPNLLLNPGVIINDDKNAHIKNLKELPAVEEEVDKCIECGYCEHKCPSRDITATPRRRIVIRRALKKLQSAGDTVNYNLLLKQSEYDVMDTCAVDGLCATACPVDINTGDLVKRLRRENHSAKANRVALFVAKHFKFTERLLRIALKSGTGINHLLGKNTLTKLTGGVKKIFPAMPLWSAQINAAPDLKVLKMNVPVTGAATTIIYFPSCISRMLGTYQGKEKNILQTFISVCSKSGVAVKMLDNVSGSCCSQIFSSKGFSAAAAFTANAIAENLYKSSEGGRFSVVIDVSSCAYTLHHIRPLLSEENKQKFDQLTILDSVDFLHGIILPVAVVQHKKANILLHPVCSLEKMKTTAKFIQVAKHFAATVTVPENTGCCGMAGDRGFLFPALTASATNHEASEIRALKFDGYYSTTKTCEMAMSAAVDQNYESILYLVDEAI
ncbi:FAD-binding and (Fe-S)-binding domain-containing protein [Ferruginibacter paludis]|uniref:FAD-binding and (Fe-S)-binding domain-containing protein n=1 Tax=Ferruginibacter paludis TaxID=1310417 RepID=UPI0025B39282|nr:FAD-binding and (Fe-S)-binding domain-containing protein [Ferruginibacter paludis]MDN3657332.1 FAD-binding and (Fe-S)-binding domain-containing protein [Ferruginibacter paludis]